MSGYLSRLVSGGMRPVESIHPLVGSIYSPIKCGDPGGDAGDHNLLPGPAGSRFSAKDRQPRREPEAAQENDRTFPGSGEAPMQVFMTQPDVTEAERLALATEAQIEWFGEGAPNQFFHRHLRPGEVFNGVRPTTGTANARWKGERIDRESQDVSETSTERQSGPQDLLDLPPARMRRVSSGAASVEESGSTNSIRSSRPAIEGITAQPVYQPIVPGNRAGEGAATTDKPSDMTAAFRSPGSHGGNRSSFIRPGAPIEKEKDEVQIHIGRIEVTAWPPAPIRPVTQPPRKGLSLEEYLKRSDRGSR